MASALETYLLSLIGQLAVPVTVAPISTSSNGTPSSGTTETFDAVLGYYHVNLIAGCRYLAVVNGLIGNAGVANDEYTLQIRDSGTSSPPTAASTLIAQSEWWSAVAASSGRQSIALGQSFIASSTGPHTFGMSSTKVLGTGPFTPVGMRELYVMYLGVV